MQGFCAYTLSASNRYVSYQWNTGSTDSTIAVNSSGTYIVSVVDIFGRISSDTIVVNLPSVHVNVPNTVLCTGNSTVLTTLYSSPQYSFDWNNGLANTDAITVNSAGIYYVKVTDINSSCVKYSDTVSISIDNFSSTVSLGPDVTLCSGNIIKLVSPTNISQLTYSWSPGGTTDSSIVVNSSGMYAVTVSNVNGCTASDAVNVTVTGSAPIASFSGDTLCLGEAYLPINTSYVTDASTIVANSWNFGDGGNSSVPSPAYYYVTASSYVATLTVTTSSGCNATAVRNVLVRALPSSSISNNTLGCTNNAVFFTAQAVPAQGSNIVQWNWEFGDGGVSNIQSPQHTYGTVSSFNPQLIVTDNYGCKDTSVSSITITNNAPTPSAVSYVVPSNNIVAGSTNVNFEWTAGNNAIAYRLVIANDSTFTSATSYYFGNGTNSTVSLSQNAIYYWKVRAYNVCNDSVDFARRSFTILHL